MSVRKSLVQARFVVGEEMDHLSVEVRPGVRVFASGFAPVAESLRHSNAIPWRVAYSLLHLAYEETGYSLAERIEAVRRSRAAKPEAEVDSGRSIDVIRRAA